MKYSFKHFDSYLDMRLGVSGYRLITRLGQYLATFALIVLVGMCTAHFVINQPVWQINIIRADLQHISDALHAANNDCQITGVSTGLHNLDFLTSAHMPADHCGITLAAPNKWRGPYLVRKPAIKGIAYQLLKTTKHLFIVPGDGVVLPNGMQIGRDLNWHATTNVQALSRTGGPLFYQSGAFTRQVVLLGRKSSRATNPLPAAAVQLSNWFAEFGDAMTFASNDDATARAVTL